MARLAVWMAAFAAAGVVAAPGAAFEKVPADAKKALGREVGKPITRGIVFVNGHYLEPDPSYQVVRDGTAVYLWMKQAGGKKKAVQLTPPLKSWNAFLETQPAENVEEEASPAEPAPEPERPAAAEKPKEPKPAPPPPPAVRKPEPEDVDDFFDDEDEDDGASKSSDAERKAEEPKAEETESNYPDAEIVEDAPPAARPSADARKAPPSKPKPNLRLTGAFAKNEASDRLLKSISDARRAIDAGIRKGRIYFFSARVGMKSYDSRLAAELIKVLPSLMKNATNGSDLYRRLRAKNIIFLPEEVCQELMANKVDYLKLDELRLRMKSDAETNRLIYGR